MPVCIPVPTCHPCAWGCPQTAPEGSTSLHTPAASGAVWRGGCHPSPRGMSRHPRCGVTPSLGWWHAVPWVVACHPQNSVTLSPEQCQMGQAKLHSPAGRDAEMASGPKLGCRGGCGVPPAAVLLGRAQTCVGPAAIWHRVRGAGGQKPHTDICHPKGEPWRGEEGSGRKPRRWLGVAEFAGGRKRLLGESKSKPKKKRAKPAWQDGGGGVRSALSTPQPEHPRTPIVMFPLPTELGSPGRQWDGGGEGWCFCPPARLPLPHIPTARARGQPPGMVPTAGPYSWSPQRVPSPSPRAQSHVRELSPRLVPWTVPNACNPRLVPTLGPHAWSLPLVPTALPHAWCPHQVPKAVQGAWSLRLVLPPGPHTQTP